MAIGWTQPPTETRKKRNLLGSRTRPARKGDNLAAICEPTVYIIGIINISQPYGPPQPPLWSSDQSSWLQIQRSGFDSRRCQILWEVAGLERDPLVSTTEELFVRKSSGSGLETREYGRSDLSLWQRDNLSAKFGTKFSDKRRSLGRYSSFADSGHGDCFLFVYGL
jgi:hypothetical protein